MSILSAKPSTPQQKIKLVADLGVEYEGWCITFLNHLRDEEKLVFPLFLSVGRRYWGDGF